jgi:hypothetical protein
MEPTSTYDSCSHLPDAELGAFLRQLRRLVLDETASVRQQISQVWSKPLPSRVAEGLAIEGVRVVRVEPNGTIELACDRNASRFREGDVLLLNRGNPFDAPNLLVTLELDDEGSHNDDHVAARPKRSDALVISGFNAIGLIVPAAVPPLSLGILVTGLILGLGTRWGLVRYWWVFIKLLLNNSCLTEELA